MVGELSLDCDAFESISVPVDSSWLPVLAQKNRVIVIGSGVTAIEYANVFRRASMNFKCIAPDAVDSEDFCEVLGGNEVALIATPTQRFRVKEVLLKKGLIEGLNFYSYFNCLRNRSVFDFRSQIEFDVSDCERVSQSLKSIPTIAGCDYLLGQLNDRTVRLVNFLVSSLSELHSKYTVEITNFSAACLSELERPDVLEVVIRHQIDIESLRVIERYVSGNPSVHVHAVFIDCDVLSRTIFNSSEKQQFHPQYYDAMLSAPEMADSCTQEKTCLSRRMFPVFDSRLKLKLCSLFGLTATSEVDIECLDSEQFVFRRNKLCRRCSSRGVHRL